MNQVESTLLQCWVCVRPRTPQNVNPSEWDKLFRYDDRWCFSTGGPTCGHSQYRLVNVPTSLLWFVSGWMNRKEWVCSSPGVSVTQPTRKDLEVYGSPRKYQSVGKPARSCQPAWQPRLYQTLDGEMGLMKRSHTVPVVSICKKSRRKWMIETYYCTVAALFITLFAGAGQCCTMTHSGTRQHVSGHVRRCI